jgi:geranylgeranyl diphosphate synthase type II
LETVSRMARESAEGQMIELDWIARGDWAMTDASYVRMVYKKTTWYSFITPIRVGAIGAGATPARITGLTRFAIQLGVAFQIHDDVLNLVGSAAAYGKEIAGDLWEGKHTLILIHTMRSASASERKEAARILGKARPPFGVAGAAVQTSALGQLVSQLHAGSEITANACQRLCAAIDGHADHIYKSPEDIATLTDLIERYDSVGYARRVAERRAALAARSLQRIVRGIPTSAHTEFLRGLVDFVIRRTA